MSIAGNTVRRGAWWNGSKKSPIAVTTRSAAAPPGGKSAPRCSRAADLAKPSDILNAFFDLPSRRGIAIGVIYYNSNDHATARAMLARALWLQGFTERALNEAHASLEELRGADHQLLLCRTLYYGICRIAPMIGDFATADREIARLIEVATSLNAHFWQTAGRFLKGKLLVERGEFAQGLTVLRDAFETCGRTGWRLSYPEFKGALALAFAGLGGSTRRSTPWKTRWRPLARARTVRCGMSRSCSASKAKCCSGKPRISPSQAAEDCFNQAGEMAREQGALFWELRIALSLARLRMTQGRDGEAKQILAPVYERFTDGYETTDLRAARIMLDTLPT